MPNNFCILKSWRAGEGFIFTIKLKLPAVLVWLMISTGCSSFLYQPDYVYRITPDKIHDSPPEEVTFQNSQGVTLSGWYFKTHKKPKGQIVFFYGNAENISTHFTLLHWVLQEGYNYFIFDYQGYGKSLGKPSPKGTLLDGRAAMDWVVQRNPKLPLIIFGQSLGGAVALRTAMDLKDKIPIQAVIVDSTFLSYRGAARSVLSRHWMTWALQPLTYLVLSDRYAPKKASPISPIPLLVFHGDQDRVISYHLGEKIYKSALEPKKFVKVPGGTHIDAFWKQGKTYKTIMSQWLKEVRKNSAAKMLSGERNVFPYLCGQSGR